MQQLRVIGVEDGELLVASDDGTRFRIPVEEVLQANLRPSISDAGAGRKLAPKDVQAHIRSGMSAQDVAAITGAPLEYIQRFEGPVMAEREFVITSALAITVHTAADTDPMRQGMTFGTAIRERLHELGGTDERWASWKDATGWIVKLAFTANQIDHDARWQFDPKRHALTPLNNEAITLSQQGEAAGPLMPRLRAVSPTEPVIDSSRFDSGAFEFAESITPDPSPEPVRIARATEDEAPASHNQTADLLEALRRRRGEREAAAFDDDESRSAHPSTGSIRLVEVAPDEESAPRPSASRKKGRAAMPSWDEIVFGARPDDDPA